MLKLEKTVTDFERARGTILTRVQILLDDTQQRFPRW